MKPDPKTEKPETPALVTAQDHDAGYKDIEITRRNGRVETLRLHAPSFRQAQTLTLQLAQSKDSLCIVAAALKRDLKDAETHLNSLTPHSAGLLEAIAFALTYGDEVQKKMLAFGEQFLSATDSTGSGSNANSSRPGTAPIASEECRCPSCGFIFDFSGKVKSAATAGSPSSAPRPA